MSKIGSIFFEKLSNIVLNIIPSITGIVIGALMFDNPKFIFPVAAYALLQYLFILIYYSFVRFKKDNEKYQT